jgi:hypothetical protein
MGSLRSLIVVSAIVLIVQCVFVTEAKVGARLNSHHAEKIPKLSSDDPVYPWVKKVHIVYMTHLGKYIFIQQKLIRHFKTTSKKSK